MGESKSLLYFSGLIDLFGVALFGALYLPIIKPLGGGPLELGYLGAIYGFMQLIAGPIVGRMADKHGSKRTLMVCLTMAFLSYILFASATSLNQILVARAIAGTFEQVQPLLLARLSRAGGGEKEIGLYVAISSCAFIFGPLVGANLFDKFGPRLLLSTTASCIFFNLTFLFLILPSDPPRKQQEKKEEESAGLVDLVTRDLLLVGRMCAHSSLFFRLLFIRFSAFLGIAFQVLVNIDHMEWRFALPLPTIGLVFAIVSVAGSIGGAFTGWLVYLFGSNERALRFALLLHAVGFLGSFLCPSLYGFVALQAAFAFSNTLCIALGTKFVVDEGTLVLSEAPKANEKPAAGAKAGANVKQADAKAESDESTAGTVMGCAQVAFALVQLIAPPLSGALASSSLGPLSSPLFAAGVLILAVFVGLLPLTRGHLKAN